VEFKKVRKNGNYMMASAKPNILIITTHDSGRNFGCYGVPCVHTPSIDGLAEEGVVFTRMFGASPICSPSRGALLTGRYPLANGLVGLTGGSWNWELNDYRQHLSHLLQDSGYYTAMFGHQHETVHIKRLGFEDVSRYRASNLWEDRDTSAANRAQNVATDVASFLHEYTDRDRPFYAQVGFFETHTPYRHGDCKPDDELGVWIPPYAKRHTSWANLLERFGNDPQFARQYVAEFQGALRQVDSAVGIILKALLATGLDTNTFVLFNTDHGPELPGAKWTMYDPGLGIAFVMRWPAGGISGGRRCGWLLNNIDFLPTLFELIGLEALAAFQGVSFSQACRQDVSSLPSPRAAAFGNHVGGLMFSVRTTKYKLIRTLVSVNSTQTARLPYELYDLDLDPLEVTNVVREPIYADVLREMVGHLDGWLREIDDPCVHGPIKGDTHEDMIVDYRRRYEQSHAPVR